jgi:hypothetical protein
LKKEAHWFALAAPYSDTGNIEMAICAISFI